MLYWPKNLASYAFNATEVEKLTNVRRATQRQWLVRYMDFRQQQFIHHGEPDNGTWSWEGVQLLALFAQSLADLNDANQAKAVLMLEDRRGTTRDPLGIYHTDQRRPDGEDLLIVGYLEDPEFGFSTTGASSLPVRGRTKQPSRLYVVNFSEFQSDLYGRVTALIDLENGPGAVPKELQA